MFKNLDEMKAHVHGKVKATVVIAGAHTESVLDAAILAKQEGLADSLLVGNKQKILALLEKMSPEQKQSFEIADTGDDLVKAAQLSVQLVNEGKADIILKGKSDSGMVMRAALDKEKGLRLGDVISDSIKSLNSSGSAGLFRPVLPKISILISARVVTFRL
jgi:phosphate butyryltransferase